MFKGLVFVALIAFAYGAPAPEAKPEPKAAPEPKPGVAFAAPLISSYSSPLIAAPYSYAYSSYVAAPLTYSAAYAYPAAYSAPIVYA